MCQGADQWAVCLELLEKMLEKELQPTARASKVYETETCCEVITYNSVMACEEPRNS